MFFFFFAHLNRIISEKEKDKDHDKGYEALEISDFERVSTSMSIQPMKTQNCCLEDWCFTKNK